MLRDANEAAELNDQYVKAFLAIGEALVELGKQDISSSSQIDKGMLRLRKAYSLCTGQRMREMESYIQQQILKAQKIKYYKQKEVETDEKASLLHDIKKQMGLQGLPASQNDTIERFQKFLDRDEDHKPLDVPDFLKCPISDELMEDPVVIQSGHTYEKALINKHFERNGATDPITRQTVDPSVTIPNHMLKKASEHYLTRNPWAF